MSKSNSFNELSKTTHAVWCELNPGIDPASWAWLCRRLGQLTVEDFDALRRQPQPRTLVRNLLKSWMKRVASQKTQSDEMPLVSIGPSGIGGLYQKEITLNSRQVSTLRQSQLPRTHRVDVRA